MKRSCVLLVQLTVLAFAFAQMASAADLYVATNGTGDGSSWADATDSIQGAIDTISGDYTTNTVWVSNGVYEVGGRTNYPSGGLLTNRVAITKAITVRSANNDPTNTIIKGNWDPGDAAHGLGPAAVRCVYMAANSSLIGFMLTNGATLAAGDHLNGGGAYCWNTTTPTISNCIIAGNSAGGYGGGVYYGTLRNCLLIGNYAAMQGGGTRSSGFLYDCILTNNSSAYGGGVAHGSLFNCSLFNNTGSTYGGGVWNSTMMSNCTLTGNTGGDAGGAYNAIMYNCTSSYNSARIGGGAQCGALFNCTIVSNTSSSATAAEGGGTSGSTLSNCTVIGNTTGQKGGGVSGGIAYNCLIIGNSATTYGGGAYGGTQYNCTIANNSASTHSGGASSNRLNNCIVYFNDAPAGSNWNESDATIVFTNSCTAPAKAGWEPGNITGNPMLANTNAADYRLCNISPCINTGTNQNWMTNSYDLDGRIRIRYVIVDMGTYEFINAGTIFSGW